MAVSTNPLLFLTEYSKELHDEIAKDGDYDLESYHVSTIVNEEITIVTEVVEEFLVYFEDEDSPDVLKYNMRILGQKFENLAQDAKTNGWDSQKTKNVFQDYEKELKKIQKNLKKGRAKNPEKDEYDQLLNDFVDLEKKCHRTRSSCVIL